MTSSDSSETISDNLVIGILDDIREHVQLADLPDDLLAAIVAFADLEVASGRRRGLPRVALGERAPIAAP